MKCTQCKETFDPSEAVIRTENEKSEFWGQVQNVESTFYICPFCGSEEIEDE